MEEEACMELSLCESSVELLQHLQRHEERIEWLLQQHQNELLEALEAVRCGSQSTLAADRTDRELSTHVQDSLRALLPEPPPKTTETLPLPPGALPHLRALASSAMLESNPKRGSCMTTKRTQDSCISSDVPTPPAGGPALLQSSPKHNSGDKVSQNFRQTAWQSEAAAVPSFADREKSLCLAAEHVFDDKLTNDTGLIRIFAMAIVKHKFFELTMVAMILANCFCVGAQADWRVHRNGEPLPVVLSRLDLFFTCCFTLELVFRFLAEGFEYIWPDNRLFYWNMFDIVIVVSALVDVVLQHAWPSGPTTQSLAMRLVRMLRITRVLRIIKVMRFFQDLRVLIAGITASMKSLVWALLLLLMLAFVVGVCIMDVIANELDREVLTTGEEIDVRKYFGSLARTLYSLYKAITGGESWGDMGEPLIKMHVLLGVFFCLYIAVAVLCVLNIITGLFVENAKHMSQQDETQFLVENVHSRKARLDEVKELFVRVADPITQDLNLESFMRAVTDVRVQAYFKRLGLDVEHENVAGLFELLDFTGDGVINLDEFTLGIQLLHGSAKSIDMARVRYSIGILSKQMADMLALVPESRRKSSRMSFRSSVMS